MDDEPGSIGVVVPWQYGDEPERHAQPEYVQPCACARLSGVASGRHHVPEYDTDHGPNQSTGDCGAADAAANEYAGAGGHTDKHPHKRTHKHTNCGRNVYAGSHVYALGAAGCDALGSGEC